MSEEFRLESDSMGEVEVPVNALYGAQTQRAVSNFQISGLTMPRAFIRALGLVKCACAQVNAELELLDATKAEAIEQAAFEVAEGKYDAQFPVDVFQTGSGTSTNMNANEVIATLAGAALGQSVHPNDDVNMGQSSNDVIPASLHVSVSLEIVEELLPSLDHLQRVIEYKAKTLAGIVKTGRTHLMDAMPITFEQELKTWASQISLNKSRLEDSLKRLTELAQGGTAIGTGINTHKDFAEKVASALAVMTSIPFKPKKDLAEGISSQDASVEISGQLKTLAVSLMKISNDLRWLNSGPLAGLGEIVLPPVQPGSSIMPGKVNPVIPEAVAMACAQVIGNDTTVTVAGQSGNFQLNVMLPVIAYNLLQSVQLLKSASKALADQAIAGFEVNEEQVSKTLAYNPILVTALNAVIGYDKGAEIAKKAYAQKRPVLEVAVEETGMPKKKLQKLLDPILLTQGGIKR